MIRDWFFVVLLTGELCVCLGGSCTVRENVMDCTNLLLADCPAVNTSVSELIMDKNKVKDLSTGNCSKWTHLEVLRASYNELVTLVDFRTFSALETINVSHNLLEKVYLSGEMLFSADFTYNRIVAVSGTRVDSLKVLLLGHNSLDPEKVDDILKDSILPSLGTLDLSYNELPSVPMAFINFSPSFLTHINLSGNKIPTVYLSMFTYPNHKPVHLDVSWNLVSSLVLSRTPSIHSLDLSHNHFSFLDVSSLDLLRSSVDTMDLSQNPFNCSCKFSPPFVTWMRNHKDKFVHKKSTNCSSTSGGPNIFDPVCATTPPPPPPSSPPSSPPTMVSWDRPWIIRVTTISATILAVIIILGILLITCRRKLPYSNLEPWKVTVTLSRVTSLVVNLIRRRKVGSDEAHLHSDSGDSLRSNQLEFEDKLLILCSPKDTKWVSKEIGSHLRIKKQILDHAVSGLPSAEFILIIVNGDESFKDKTFLKNTALAFQVNEESELRVLVRLIPGPNSLKSNHVLSEYFRTPGKNHSFLEFEEDYPLSSIDSLKVWLNLGS